MPTVQVPVLVQTLGVFQPVNVDPAFAVAVSLTLVPVVNEALQVVPQLRPAGLDVTVPDPLPVLVTVRVFVVGVTTGPAK
jgi:hypothetical protein